MVSLFRRCAVLACRWRWRGATGSYPLVLPLSTPLYRRVRTFRMLSSSAVAVSNCFVLHCWRGCGYLFLSSLLMRVTHATKLFVAATPALMSAAGVLGRAQRP